MIDRSKLWLCMVYLNERMTNDIELNVIMAYCKEVWIGHAENTKWPEQLENANNFRL